MKRRANWFSSKIFVFLCLVALLHSCQIFQRGPHPAPYSGGAPTTPESNIDDMDPTTLLRVEFQKPAPPPLIEVERHYRVYLGEEFLGTITVSGPGAYGVKPHVRVLSASGVSLFAGLWEEPFVYEELPDTVASTFF